MRYHTPLTILSAALGIALAPLGCQREGLAQEPHRVPVHDARTFFETVALFGASFSHDEQSLLVSSDASGVFNVYRYPIDGGTPVMLTHSETDAIRLVGCFPEDGRFLFTCDQGGNELNHLYVMERNGTTRDLTPGEKLKAQFVDWSGDGKSFWVATTERDPRYFDLYRYHTEDYRRERVVTNTEGYYPGLVSPDGRWILLMKLTSTSDSDLHLWDSSRPDSKPILLTPHEGKVVHSPLCFTRDSRELYYATDQHGEFAQAWACDLQTMEHRAVLTADWDVESVSFSDSGRYRFSAINQDARTQVSILDTRTGEKLSWPALGPGEIRSAVISQSDARLAFTLNGDTSPSNLYVLDLETRDCRQLTNTLNPAIRSQDLVAARTVRYPSFDGLAIPALVYRPWIASAEHKVPALVWVHGGPGGQSRHGYNPALQHLVNQGYAVLAVNNRGSSGYGKTFYKMDDRKHGEVDLQDCVHARRYLEGLNWIDGERIGIIGGSYGGYMVAAALTFEPETFDVGIDIFGVTNWLRTMKSIPPWWGAAREALIDEMGDPAVEEARLRRISPLFHASRIRRPMLVVQGANDPRVLRAESDEIVAVVRANEVPVEYIVFPDEGHGFLRRENRIRASEAFVSFLAKHL